MVWSDTDIQDVALNEEGKKLIAQRLRAALEDLTVVHGTVLHPYESMRVLSILDRGLPAEFMQALGLMVNKTNPLSVFFHALIDARLKQGQSVEVNGSPVLLKQVKEFNDLDKVTEELVAELDKLPYEYTVYIKLPLQDDLSLTTPFTLSDGLTIVRADDTLMASNTKTEDMQIRPGRPVPFAFAKSAYYLKCDIKGFIPDYFQTETLRRFIEIVKSLAGLGVASMLLERKNALSLPIENEEPIGVFSTGESVSARDHHLSREDSVYLRSLSVRKGLAAQSSFIYMLANLSQDSLPNSEEEAIDPILKLLSRAFIDSKDAENVRLAGQWYFDGLCSDHYSQKFVQFTSVLEILLGGGEEEGMVLTTLMANRCAYLIGYDHDKRREIASRFEEVYITRSRMLHQEDNIISVEDEHTLSELKTLCFQVILRELGLLPQRVVNRFASLLMGAESS